ncbi:Uncharacterised protein [Candidatus Norongarragalina meridionalis]|nr:Uncharacterised protein [Candidatus Norongarragalina meridionalis]
MMGSQRIVVFNNGEPANGTLEITDSGGTKYVRILADDGSVDFFFDDEGNWKIQFMNTTKIIRVTKKKETPVVPTELVPKTTPKPITGLVTAAGYGEWLQWFLLLLLLLALAYLIYKKLYAVVSLTKKFDGKKVTLSVTNRKDDLHSVMLLDVAPEGSNAHGFSDEPDERKETISGDVFKWKKIDLKRGEKWSVSYSLDGAKGKILKRAELTADGVHSLS